MILTVGEWTITCGDIALCKLSDTVNASVQLCQIAAAYTDQDSGERLLAVCLLERFADENLLSRFDEPPFVQCSGTVRVESGCLRAKTCV